jgi:hypothetical protein
MFKKLQTTAVLLCMLSYAEAGTVSIGTASARGDFRIDNRSVKGNATLFDGSVIQTSQASADLRLNKGVEITLSAASRGTLYSDHIVLQQGQSELMSSGAFQLQANGLHIVPGASHSRGVVSMKAGNTIEVASLDGNVGVSNDNGVVLANILPGNSFTFAMQAGANATDFEGVGLVTFENGTYYLTTDSNVRYILTCKDSHSFVGNKVVVTGSLQGGAAGGNGGTLCAKSMEVNGPTSMSRKKKWIVAGILMAAGAGIGIGLAASNSSSHPASR